MEFNKSDFKQFTTEIYFYNKNKDFKGTSKEILLRSRFKSIKLSLDDKRKQYDYGLINIYKKYNVSYDDVSTKLDDYWENYWSKDNIIYNKFKNIEGINLNNKQADIIYNSIFAGSKYLITIPLLYSIYEMIAAKIINDAWKSYRGYVIELSNKKAQVCININEKDNQESEN